MKKMRKLICVLFAVTLFATLFTGCQKKETEAECPFTTIKWGATLDDITKLEGDYLETYDSSYKGTTYTYNKKFGDLDGIIKYMFDDKDKLVGMAWTYVSEDAKDVESVYEKIHTDAEELLGESGYDFGKKEELNKKLQDNEEELNASGMTSTMTDVWYREEGNVTMNAVITEDVKAVQYTFLHPDVSQEDPEK